MKAKLKIIIPIAIAVVMIISAVLLISFGSVGSEAPMSAFETAQQYLLEHNYEQAIIEFEKALELDPMNVEARLGLAQAYQSIGDAAKAAEVLQSGYELTGDERLNDMLKELTGEEAVQAVTETEAVVTTVSESSDETAEAVMGEEKNLFSI